VDYAAKFKELCGNYAVVYFSYFIATHIILLNIIKVIDYSINYKNEKKSIGLGLYELKPMG